MRSDDIIRNVGRHLDAGGDAKLMLDKGGRRFVKLVRWGFFGPKHEITGATAVSIEQMIAARRHQDRQRQRRAPA